MASINEIKNRTAEKPKPKKKTKLERIHEFDFKINKKNASKIVPFMVFIALWGGVYIANRHYGEKTMGKIDRIHRELKDLKADYDTYNADLSNKTTQTEVANLAAPLGLKELVEPPKRLKLK